MNETINEEGDFVRTEGWVGQSFEGPAKQDVQVPEFDMDSVF